MLVPGVSDPPDLEPMKAHSSDLEASGTLIHLYETFSADIGAHMIHSALFRRQKRTWKILELGKCPANSLLLPA